MENLLVVIVCSDLTIGCLVDVCGFGEQAGSGVQLVCWINLEVLSFGNCRFWVVHFRGIYALFPV